MNTPNRTIRISDEDWARYRAEATRRGMTVSEWLRFVVNRSLLRRLPRVRAAS